MKERLLLALTAFGCLLMQQIYDMYSATYHRFSESPGAAIAGGVIAPLLLASLAFVAGSLLRSAAFMRLLVGLLALYSFEGILAALVPGAWHIESMRVVYFLVGIGLLLTSLRYFQPSAWARMARITLAAVTTWILVLPASAWFHDDEPAKGSPTLSVSRIVDKAPGAVAILILDEASEQIIPGLRAAIAASPGQAIHVGTSTAAGDATIYAIPSMLTTSRHDNVVPCGAAQLCGGMNFDMRNLQATQADTDVVGTYHPYCEIQGLRSCWTAQVTNADSPSINGNLLRAIGRRLPLVGEMFDVELKEAPAYDYVRSGVAAHAFKAPFWQNGGTLYIHYLRPHPTSWPTWDSDAHNLFEEYTENMRRAAGFARQLNDRLKDRFGIDYALIVTSDHPLRTSFWCGRSYFFSADCVEKNRTDSSLVPFAVLAPDTAHVSLPATNVGVFTPLPSKS